MIRSWDKRLPRTGDQWKAIGLCTFLWIAGIGYLSRESEQAHRRAVEGAPKYSFVKPTDNQSLSQPTVEFSKAQKILPPVPATFRPLDTRYLPGKETFEKIGYSKLQLKNNSDSNFHIKLYKNTDNIWTIQREAYLRAGEDFAMSSLSPGEYEVRKIDVQTKDASKSQSFDLKETREEQGVRYSTISLAFKVIRGNTRSIPITARDF